MKRADLLKAIAANALMAPFAGLLLARSKPTAAEFSVEVITWNKYPALPLQHFTYAGPVNGLKEPHRYIFYQRDMSPRVAQDFVRTMHASLSKMIVLGLLNPASSTVELGL